MLASAVAAGGVAGVLMHRCVFIKGDWHLQAPMLVQLHALVLGVIVILNKTFVDCFIQQLSHALLLASLGYLVGLYGSIAVYRLFFHPLKSFPGPRLAALSKIWHVLQCRNSQNHVLLESMRQRYGTFVRTGPNEITIFHPAAIETMDGAKNHNTRSDWYDLLQPRVSTIFSRTSKDHTERRVIWTQALSTQAIKDYLPRITRQIASLDGLIDSYGSEPLLANDVMQWFAFDSMGEFAFNEDFGMMKSRTWHQAISQQRSALALLGPLGCAIWIIRLALAFAPGVWRVKHWYGMLDFCDGRMEKRLQNQTKVTEPDVASYFIREMESKLATSTPQEAQNLLSGNAVSLIVGGSDTTGPTLILLWYFLALYPQHTERIHQELLEAQFTKDTNDLAALPYLNGFINEIMRLVPAALTMGTRITPAEGLTLDGTYIPGHTKIATSRYSVSRLESAFENATELIPERWSTRPEMVKDKRAFAPFGVGRRGCVGKTLALTQIRLVLATLIPKYHVSFAPGVDTKAVLTNMKDQMTAQPGHFRLIFQKRSPAGTM